MAFDNKSKSTSGGGGGKPGLAIMIGIAKKGKKPQDREAEDAKKFPPGSIKRSGSASGPVDGKEMGADSKGDRGFPQLPKDKGAEEEGMESTLDPSSMPRKSVSDSAMGMGMGAGTGSSSMGDGNSDFSSPENQTKRKIGYREPGETCQTCEYGQDGQQCALYQIPLGNVCYIGYEPMSRDAEAGLGGEDNMAGESGEPSGF